MSFSFFPSSIDMACKDTRPRIKFVIKLYEPAKDHNNKRQPILNIKTGRMAKEKQYIADDRGPSPE